MLTFQEGEPIELNLTYDIIAKALRLQEGNHVISNMKLTSRDRLLAFITDNTNGSVYASLRDYEIWLVL